MYEEFDRLSKKQMNRIIGRKPTAGATEVHIPKNKYKRKHKYKEDFYALCNEEDDLF